MSGADEVYWVAAATSDDAMVADLLLRLHHAPPTPLLRKRPALPLEWTVRRRRSEPASGINNPAHRGRGSPTTPLSWSGATSEASSRSIKHSGATRSKIVNVHSDKTNSKIRSRKKKTLAELKEEENSLLKERRDLKKEMAALGSCLERQRATNENLKRRKTELQCHPDIKSKPESIAKESISDHLEVESTAMLLTAVEASAVRLILQPWIACPEGDKTDAKFVLPDLNIPFDEPISEFICGMRC